MSIFVLTRTFYCAILILRRFLLKYFLRSFFMNRAELKQKAKEQIKGKIGILFVITMIIGAVSGIAGVLLSFIPVVGSLVASIIVTPAFALSLVRVYLMVIRYQNVKAGDAFCGFEDFWSAFKVTFLVGLFTYLWSLLFVIPGIIKSISYSMSMYILADNPGKGALECINESKKMTEGHKAELFVLSLSFLGWSLLGAFTLGIAYIWVIPYMSATFANAYESLKPTPVFASPATEPNAESPELIEEVVSSDTNE